MVLQFKFKYLSSDKTLVKSLDYCLKLFSCKHKILQDLNYVYLFVEADEEVLKEFSEFLSLNLPMSIFYYKVDIEVVNKIPPNEATSLKEDKLISFCSSCLKEIENEDSLNYYNVFNDCGIYDNYSKGSYFILDNEKVDSNKELFKKLAFLINDGKKIKIKTLSGIYVFSKFENLNSVDKILVTNLKKISEIVVVNKIDIVALASIEKPSIDFKVNEIYKQQNNIDKSIINMRVANDLTLYLLSVELQKYEINFLQIEEENVNYDSFLNVLEEKEKKLKLDIPKIKCFENRKLFIESNSYPKNLDNIYNKFDEHNKSHFMTVLAENQLFEKSILNFYISLKNDDGISFYSTTVDGLIDISKPLFIPSNIKEVFDEIKKDEVGARLLENYKNKFPIAYEKALNSDISNLDKKSFFNYWKIIQIILNFETSILENAKKCFLEKGPKIDYILSEDEKLFNREFNYLKLIKSGLSFKLAGVEDETISLGYVESLALFIGNEVDKINSLYNLDGVSLCGDMFKYDIFNLLVEKSITKNFNIYFNREFVIEK